MVYFIDQNTVTVFLFVFKSRLRLLKIVFCFLMNLTPRVYKELIVIVFYTRENGDWGRLRKAMAPKLLRPRDVQDNLGSFCNMARDAIEHMVKMRGTAGLENEIPDLEEVLLKFAAESKLQVSGTVYLEYFSVLIL